MDKPIQSNISELTDRNQSKIRKLPTLGKSFFLCVNFAEILSSILELSDNIDNECDYLGHTYLRAESY